MAPRMDDVMRLCRETSAHDEIKLAVKNSTKGAIALVAGGSILVGGLLGGPPGIAVGGVLGALFGWLTSGQFRPLPQILMELSPDQRQKLYDQVTFYLINLVWTNKAQLVTLVMGNATLQQQVTAALLNYVTRELGSKVCFGD
ncbi:protein C19orf12 homolog isoform X3 [Anarhichas minor]|uniref:protein C19orf12 homolog isoform X3 n=1 Tax=Anarhichas minor TaxID=65739 RepID=UPI003F7385D4